MQLNCGRFVVHSGGFYLHYVRVQLFQWVKEFVGDAYDTTFDNGPEFAAYKMLTQSLGLSVYFADPYCACQ